MTKGVSKGKRKLPEDSVKSSSSNVYTDEEKDIGLFRDAPPDKGDRSSGDSDSSDSEESVYSGLEEEDDSSDEADSEVESFEEAADSSADERNDSSSSNDESESREKDPKTTLDAKEGKTKHSKFETDPDAGKTKELQPSVSSNYNEYDDFDSSDEEDIRNTVGNIPMEWYKEYGHLGYDLLGKKISKPKQGDELDEFLNKMDNPDYWRTVKDKATGQNVILSQKDVESIDRLRSGKYVDPGYNPYEPAIDFFTYETMIHPVTNRPEHKRSFIPSKWERLKVGRIVHAIKMGWIKPRKPAEEKEDEPQFYDLWGKEDESEISKRFRMHIPAPKMPLPGHAESYNPPPEYLFTEEEELAWREKDPEDRRINFIPQKYSSLRHVPAYSRFINERFERCLDLYLCPRQRKMRMNVDPQDLIPKLPKPKDLQPFPTTQSIIYKGHTGLVRCISLEDSGQWLVSGSDDHTVRFWEIATGRCMKTYKVDGVVKDVAWNPSPGLCLVAVVVEDSIIIINPALGDELIVSNTDHVINSYETPDSGDENTDTSAEWTPFEGQDYKDGYRLKITHSKTLSQVSWHGRGDYMSAVMPQGEGKSVLIHQLSKRRSQNPFKKSKGLVQCVLFHPTRPFLFVATQRYVRVYNLLKQELTKKLMTNCKWVSSMAVHPGGDNLIIGSYDCRLSWFDLDLSTKPYQTLRHHKKALRQVCYHKRYPLFASASDDGTVIICHGMVYNDLLQNPLIVPVKILRGHEATKDLGVLDCEFHPTQPWIFTSGSDSTVRLFT